MTRVFRVVVAVAAVAVWAACGAGAGAGAPPERTERQDETGDSVTMLVTARADTIELLEYPIPRRGHLVTHSAGDLTIEGSWRVRAGMCDDPAMLELVADESDVGTIILLVLPPDEGDRVTTYPVPPVERAVPPPPAARIGVQVFEGRSASFFQAIDGEVEVHTFGEWLGGRYLVTMWELTTGAEMQYAGVFEGIRIKPLSDEQCIATSEEFQRSRALPVR